MRAPRTLTVVLLIQAFSAGQDVPPSPLQGTVLDPARVPITGAAVTLVPANGLPDISVHSNRNGEFLLSVAPGTYTMKISKEGFLDVSMPVTAPTNSPVEIVLQIIPIFQSLTVIADDPYVISSTESATKTSTPLRDVPQSITVVTRELIHDQMMSSIGDVVRYVPGVTSHQGENNRDQLVIRGNSTSADFFVNGVRDDVQYYRDLYNLDRVEVLKGPNAMIFGRGGGGGVVNRVTKEAIFVPLREFTLQGGSFNNKRFGADLNQMLGSQAAVRLNGIYENSDSFRDYLNLQRYGINPTVTLTPSKKTRITLAYENFHDQRTADRGISSFQGRPVDVPISTFFGNPNDSHVRALVNLGSTMVEHQAGRFTIRNRTQFGGYGRSYQNYVPGAVTADKSQVALTAYNNATARLNIFNQTDVSFTASTARIRHTFLAGAEFGRQITDNFRNTGFFNNTATSVLAPLANPVIATPVTYRQSATDADNHIRTRVSATYAQDQMDLSRYVQLVLGLRFDRFDLNYHNNRNNDNLRRTDDLISPRAGIVIRPLALLSIYGNYSISYLPSSGDQFSSLTTITQQVKPEKFANYESGVKWEVARYLSVTAAVYRLDRTNTRATDPNDPTRIIQTGSQRTNGFEMGVNGSLTRQWKIAGGVSYQDAFVTSATASARAGAQVAQVPHHTFSLWNNYQIVPRLGAGLGIVNRSDMFAAIDNTVTLPGYTRADAAVFFTVREGVRLQANVENLFATRYYNNADSNTNISPGAPRTVRVGLTAKF